MAAQVNQQISGLTVSEGGKLFAGYYNSTTNNIYSGAPKLLPYSTKAAFNAFGKDETLCLPNTRVNILNQIRAWIDGDDGTNIFWLSGWAGTGKTIIAQTISREYHDKGRQGGNFFASFFFSRGEEDVSDASKFVTTIAVELAKSPVLGERINKAVLDDDWIANKILQDQWKHLVIEPMSKLDVGPVCTLVLVIDALDECGKQGDIRRVLQLLANAGTLRTVRLRALVTSRPNPDIRHSFSQILQGVYQESILHDISKSAVNNDIHIFFNHKFECTLPTDWPGEQAIKHLVQKAAGLFIWAATAYRFIHEGKPFHEQRLHLILQGEVTTIEPEAELNKIYITVLKNSVRPNYDEQEKENFYKMLKEILGSIVILFSPLSADSLANLINFPGTIFRSMLDHLHSVLDIPEGRTNPIRLHHPSFRDFFLDTKRCTDRQLQVDGYRIHWALANSCIRIMFAMLKKDICNLHLPGALASEVDDNKIEQYIPEELQYACSYWVQHLQKSENPLLDNGDVHLFLQKRLLFWLEALSLLGKMTEGIMALISLENLVKFDQSPSLHAFTHDAKRFALSFRYIIEKAPLQIYSSALLFAPEMSLIRKELQGQMPNWITGVTKGQKYWSPALQTLEGHSYSVGAIVFSPDGKLIASASGDKTVRLWDSSTGAALQTLKGHSDSVIAVKFSPDSKLVTSASFDNTVSLWDSSTGEALQTKGKNLGMAKAVAISPGGKLAVFASYDNTIRLWNLSTGAAMQTLGEHSGSVGAVAFSANGKLIASVSYDETVRLWDSSTGAALQTLKGHSGWVLVVVFSPDGKIIASASGDKTVRLWDSSTGATLQTLIGHSESAVVVVFSPDGKLVASASREKAVRLWDSSTGAALRTLKGHSDRITAVEFSPDGKLIASASGDKTVRLWDPSTGAALQTLTGHSESVTSVTFSPDSKLVASASYDQTIRLWDLSTGEGLQKSEKHSYSFRAVEFSPNGKLVASASGNGLVTLWNSSTGAALQTLEGHSSWVLAVVFSPDGKIVASASGDETVRLWDSSTGTALQTLVGHSGSVWAIAFSPDGKLLASASWDKTVRLWDPSTGAALQTLKRHSELVEAVVFSPDGKFIASASRDKTVTLWDSSTGAALQTLEWHSGWVTAVAFSPDGNLVASASYDRKIWLWDLATGVVLETFETLARARKLGFSQDGSYLETDKGFQVFLTPSSKTPFPNQPAKVHISLQGRWIVGRAVGTMGNLLWLPPNCQESCSDVRDNAVVLGHESGCMSFIRFDLSQL